jgi:hypothetical protein
LPLHKRYGIPPRPTKNRHANEPGKLVTAAKLVAAMPQKIAQIDSTMAILVRLPRRARGTTVLG